MTDEHDPQQEPEPGSTEWLLAQLSGGRIDSRRERREAEAALEARGVQFDVTTGAITLPEQPQPQPRQPAEGEEPPAEQSQPRPGEAAADDRPKARFSWETGTLQAVTPSAAADADAAVPDADAADDADDRDDELDVAPPPVSAAGQRAEPGLWFDAPDAPPLTFESTFTAADPAGAQEAGDAESSFRWNLLPTADADPALNPKPESSEPVQATPPAVVPSAAPLIAPKPLSRTDAAQPGSDAAAGADSAAAPAAPDDVPPAATPTVLPPGTTAHEFDPFAQDLFAPAAAAGTPVPSVDEFTIPDEERERQASVPTQAIPTQDSAPTEAMPVQPSPPAPTTPATPAHDDEPAPVEHQVSSNWTDITDMLGANPETVESSIVPEWPPPEGTFDGFAQAVAPAADALAQAVAPAAVARQAAGRPGSAPVEHRRRLPVNRWLVIAAAVLVIVLIAVLLYTVGRAVASDRTAAPAAATTHSASASPSASTTPTPTPTTTTAVLPATGTLPAGQTYQWDQLRGGECINPFGGAWAQQYAVVDCNSAHAAQLVYTAPYSANPSAAFPGQQAIASQIDLLCSKPGVIDMAAAAAYTDVQLVASYPVTAAQWAAGQRNYYCFVTRSSGQSLTSSVQGPGPGQ